MKIISTKNANINKIVAESSKVLKNGGLVVYPTETCYGLGADATKLSAINKLLKYKRRREGKPLSVLVANSDMANNYVKINNSAANIYKQFLPGPITVISKVLNNGLFKFAEGVASEINTVGVRISSHPIAMQLAQKYSLPITATSANPSYKRKPYSLQDFLDITSKKQQNLIDLFIDAGILPKRSSSTVIDTTLIGNMTLRSGDIKLDDQRHSFIISKSPTQTMDFAQTLMLKHWNDIRKQGVVILLSGNLGAGKTVFAKGVGKFLNIGQVINSPSYSLINEYQYHRHGVNGMFYHLDPWRLDKFDNFLSQQLKIMISPNNIIIVEWANKFLNEITTIANRHKCSILNITIQDDLQTSRKIFYK